MAEGERRDHPQAVPPVGRPIDGRQREQKQNVVERADACHVMKTELSKREQLREDGHGHLVACRDDSMTCACCARSGSSTPRATTCCITRAASASRCSLCSAQA